MTDTIQERFGGTNPAWMRGYSERFEHKGVIDLDDIGRVIREAADEIDRLQSNLEESQRDSARLERELVRADAKFEEYKRLSTEMIEQINGELAAKDKRIEELEREKGFVVPSPKPGTPKDTGFNNEVLAVRGDIFEITTEQSAAEGCLSIRKDAINAAWKRVQAWRVEHGDRVIRVAVLSTLEAMLKECFGIVACEKCGGTNQHQDGPSWCNYECDCPNNGWVIGGE